MIEQEKPHYIVPEIEAIATATLVELEAEGYTVVPTARAAQLTMNREGIRRLAAEELGLPTSPYHFADTFEDYRRGVERVGYPCVVKPIMSSSGKGQSVLKGPDDCRRPGTMPRKAGARQGPGGSSRASSISTTKSLCSPCATSTAPLSARRSVTARSRATTTSPGSRRR